MRDKGRASDEEARRMLARISTRSLQEYTGCSYSDALAFMVHVGLLRGKVHPLYVEGATPQKALNQVSDQHGATGQSMETK